MPTGDDIANALFIEPGKSGPYTNICASTEENEPVPPAGDCVSQNEWCDEFGTGEDILANSIWFTFYGPQSGAVSIAATDIDGQIALYKADSYTEILNGNYTLLAANDDKDDANFTSYIKPVNTEIGKQYWLQFDGSFGNAQGEFYIDLKETSRVDSKDTKLNDTESLKIYPQPAQDYIVAESNILTNQDNANIKIYNNAGVLLLSENTVVDNNQLIIKLNSKWSNGIYLLSIQTTNNEIVSKIFILNSVRRNIFGSERL